MDIKRILPFILVGSIVYFLISMTGCGGACMPQQDFGGMDRDANFMCQFDPCLPMCPSFGSDFCDDDDDDDDDDGPNCIDCGIPGCPDCPGGGDDDDDPPPDQLPIPESIVPCGMYHFKNDPDSYYDPKKNKVFSRDGLNEDIPTEAELNKVANQAPACTYRLPFGYYDPRKGQIFNFEQVFQRDAIQEDIDKIKDRLPAGQTDLGFAYFDPEKLIVFDYDEQRHITPTERQLACLLQEEPPGTFNLGFGFYDPETGFIHEFCGPFIREPNAKEIEQILDPIPIKDPGQPEDPPVIVIGELKDKTVKEDSKIPNFDLSGLIGGDVSPDDLTWRVVSGDPELLTTKLLSDNIVRLTLIPNATGIVPITFTLENTNGIETSKVVTYTISPVNDAPNFISFPPLVSSPKLTYIYKAKGFDVDGDLISFSLLSGPPGIKLEPVNFDQVKVSFKPEKRGITEEIVIAVDDDSGARGTQRWKVDVR